MIVLPVERSFEKCLWSWIARAKYEGSPDKYCCGPWLRDVCACYELASPLEGFDMDKVSEGQVHVGRDECKVGLLQGVWMQISLELSLETNFWGLTASCGWMHAALRAPNDSQVRVEKAKNLIGSTLHAHKGEKINGPVRNNCLHILRTAHHQSW